MKTVGRAYPFSVNSKPRANRDKEMFKTFNMGIGMVLIVNKEEAQAIDYCQGNNEKIYKIGLITKAKRRWSSRKGV